MSAVTQAITTLTTVGALVFTGLSLDATRDQVDAARAQHEVTRQGRLTDRFTKAVEQLSEQEPGRSQVRLGGIYELGRIAHESPADQTMVAGVLSSFLRTAGRRHGPACATGEVVGQDVEVALTLLGSLEPDTAHGPPIRTNASHLCLRDADLYEADLIGADLTGADVSAAFMYDVSLAGAALSHTDLSRARLFGANLLGAQLRGANLTGAGLSFADVSYGHLRDARLTAACLFAADLRRADLTGADLRGADLREADLREADLTGADLRGADLTAAQLTGARVDPGAERSTTHLPDLIPACDEEANAP